MEQGTGRPFSKNGLPATLSSVQICRGLASLCVVFYHLGGALAAPKYFGEPLYQYASIAGGAAGVDFFFVLSGFIISSVHWQDISRPSKFGVYLVKRCIRVYPVYWFVFFAVCAVALVVPGAADTIPNDIIGLLKAIALVPQNPDVVGGTGAPVIIVAWSLQYEMIFYTLFGLAILNGRLALVVIAILVTLAGIGVAFDLDLPFGFLRPEYFALFGAGVVVGSAIRHEFWRANAPAAILAGIIGFLATATILSLNAIFPSWPFRLDQAEVAKTLLFGAAAASLIFGLATLEIAGWKPTWRSGLSLGNASYMLYLIHYPIISVLCKVAVVIGLSGAFGAAVVWVGALFVCISAAILLHMLIERPLMKTGRVYLGKLRIH